jgi:ferredoxin
MTDRPASPLAAVGSAGPPRLGVTLGRLFSPLDRLFDRLYGSRWNPLYQTGNLAVLFFLTTLSTGVYLFLFYKIADPHGSVAILRERIWFGAWARSIHRYSADLAVASVGLHILRKLIQGHTWGPRALSWLSGVVMLGLVFACGWTGLVLVWDVQAQQIAIAGARIFDLLPIFSEPISRTFAGLEPVPSSFFFMNLFFHVALPLGLAGGLTVHVARLSRPALLPPKPIRRAALVAVALLALVWPVALPPAADLAALPGEIPTDFFFAFWLPLAQRLPPLGHLALWLLFLGGLASLTRLWRPERGIRASKVDEDHCSGCTTCYQDCPYDAIEMVRRERPSRQTSEYVARVDPSLCVGCGICAGSCAPMGVGPGRRTGRDQLAQARQFAESTPPTGREVAIFACGNGAAWNESALAGPGRVFFPTACSGALHTSVIELLLRRGYAGAYLLTCPPRNCYFREGPKWLAARLFEGREAELAERVDRRRVALASFTSSEIGALRADLAAFEARLVHLGVVPETELDLVAACDPDEAARVIREMVDA